MTNNKPIKYIYVDTRLKKKHDIPIFGVDGERFNPVCSLDDALFLVQNISKDYEIIIMEKGTMKIDGRDFNRRITIERWS